MKPVEGFGAAAFWLLVVEFGASVYGGGRSFVGAQSVRLLQNFCFLEGKADFLSFAGLWNMDKNFWRNWKAMAEQSHPFQWVK